MIKSHKPRGYQWTNASTFQQIEGFKEIDFEECRVRPAKVLCRGTEEYLGNSQRASKRRRIGSLALDFMNGKPLTIASARPCPRELKRTITWNKKSSDEPKFVLNDTHWTEPGPVWEDVEDPLEVLRRAGHSTGKAPSMEPEDRASCEREGVEVQIVDEEHAIASSKRPRRPKTLELASRPSDEALQQAAALRQRRLQRLESEVAARNQGDPANDADDARDIATHLPSPATEGVYLTGDSLLGGSSHSFCVEGDEQSLDELRLSRVETPSRQLKKLNMAAAAAKRPGLRSQRDSSGQSRIIQETLTPSASDISSALTRSTGAATHEGIPGATTSGYTSSRANVSTPQPRAMEIVSSTRRNFHQAPRVYTAEQNGRSNITPFMFRRRDSGSIFEQRTRTKRTGGRKSSLLASMGRTAESTNMSSPLKQSTGTSLGRSSGEQRCTSEPPTSALDGDGMPATDDSSPVNETPHEPSQFWPGTQVLLYQAQRDLFTSPKKTTPIDEEMNASSVSGAAMSPAHPSREPRRHPSQEHLPSTQALLDNFVGFSTVKKPSNAYRTSPLPTPTAQGRHGRDVAGKDCLEESATKGTVASLARKSNTCSSSLHFSGAANSPALSPSRRSTATAIRIQLTGESAMTAQTDSLNFRSALKNSETDASLPKNPLLPSSQDRTTQNVHRVPGVSIYQAGQRQPSSAPMSERDLSQTMNELTRDMLWLDDMEEIMSRA